MSLTVSQAAKRLNLSTPEINYLIREEKIKAEKLDPAKLTSPYIIKESALKAYEAERLKPRPLKRCEPCKHPKKKCLHCLRLICLNDFPTQSKQKGTKRPYCKDCEKETRKKYRKETSYR